jgi:hypothetical protein
MITYSRRYSLSALVGIAPEEDDDGSAASSMPRNAARNELDQKVIVAARRVANLLGLTGETGINEILGRASAFPVSDAAEPLDHEQRWESDPKVVLNPGMRYIADQAHLISTQSDKWKKGILKNLLAREDQLKK